MTDQKYAVQAAMECSQAATSAHHGGVDRDLYRGGRPFWNPESFQFMYVPAFQFQPIPGVKKYRYIAKDEAGNIHSFESDSASAVLEPIWKDIPEGVVSLNVYALDADGNETYQVGARTFFRLSPFTADLPEAVCSYKEASAKAYEYAMSQNFLLHWLNEGTPDPDYDHNVYPSKMISGVIRAMLNYARLCPEREADAIKIAVNAADYLLSITPADGPMAGIPPTYYIDFRPNPETRRNLTAGERLNSVMMIYPAGVGSAYLALEEKTGERRYLDAALKIGAYYRDHVQPNGSWYLIQDFRTGEVLAPDFCMPLEMIAPFLLALNDRCLRRTVHTGDGIWRELAENAIRFAEEIAAATYEWSSQFEDSPCSVNYSNLTHYPASALARYYAEYHADDSEYMARAEDLVRFVEDQFVVWKRPSPWNKSGFDTSLWLTPCGLEQYNWHVPIDASTADIMLTFLAMYKAGRGDLYLEKAKALAASITRSQQPNGLIPTHWMNRGSLAGDNFWINCLFASTAALAELSEFLGE